VDGVDDLRAVNALQVDRCDSEVGVPELPLDHDERDAFVGHLDRVSMPELMRREPTTDTGCDGRVLELLASCGGFPVPSLPLDRG
jgi:hypothetical protein